MISPTTDKIRLFAFGAGWGVPFNTTAPFPLKLETWLRMAGIPFEFVIANDPNKGPKGKSPWIEIGTERMGDSALIIEYLEGRFGINLDAHLDAQQRALAVLAQRMLEDHFHQCFEHQLFFGKGGEERLQEFAATMPIPVRWLVPTVLKRAFTKQLHARGMGRHSEQVSLRRASPISMRCLCSLAINFTFWVTSPHQLMHVYLASWVFHSTLPATTHFIDTGLQ